MRFSQLFAKTRYREQAKQNSPAQSSTLSNLCVVLIAQWLIIVSVSAADNCPNILSGKSVCSAPTNPDECCRERSVCTAAFRASRCSATAGITPQCDQPQTAATVSVTSKCQQYLQNKLQPPRAPVPLLGEAFIYFESTLPSDTRKCAQNPQQMTSEVLDTYGSDVSAGALYVASNRPSSFARGGVRSRFTNMFNFNCTSIVISHSAADQQRLYTVALRDVGYAHTQAARDVGAPIHLLVVNVPVRLVTQAEISPRVLPPAGSILPALLDVDQGSILFPYLMPGNLLQASATDFASTDDLLFAYEVYEQSSGPLNIAALSGAQCFAGRPNFDMLQFSTKYKLIGPTFGNFMTVAARQIDRWMILNNCRMSMQAKINEVGLPQALMTTAASVTFQLANADVNAAFALHQSILSPPEPPSFFDVLTPKTGNEISCKQLTEIKPAQFEKQIKSFILPNDFPTPSTAIDGPPYFALLIVNYGPVPGSLNSLVRVVSAYPALLYLEKNVQTRARRVAAVEVCAYQPPRVPPGEKHRIVILAYEYTTIDKAAAAGAASRSTSLCPAKFRSQIADELGSTTILNSANFPYATANGWQLKASNFFIANGDEDCVENEGGGSAPQNALKPPTIWGYEGNIGPAFWPQIQPKCGGKRQSPINIVKNRVVLDRKLGDLSLFDYDETPTKPWKIINNGHTAQISAVFPAGVVPELRNGGLAPQGYVFQQLHFHWGDADNPGSEHLLNFRRIPAELHIVHMRSDYAAVGGGAYTQDSSGLAVLGMFLDIGDEDNEAYEPIIRALSAVEKFNTTADVEGLTLKNLLPNQGATSDDLAFYRYAGSLTTPDCHEIVQWTVLQRPVMVSERQAEQLQQLLEPEDDDAGGHDRRLKLSRRREEDDDDDSEDDKKRKDRIIDNFRHTQPLNGRVVTANRFVSNAL